jgi:hypothetical protein
MRTELPRACAKRIDGPGIVLKRVVWSKAGATAPHSRYSPATGRPPGIGLPAKGRRALFPSHDSSGSLPAAREERVRQVQSVLSQTSHLYRINASVCAVIIESVRVNAARPKKGLGVWLSRAEVRPIAGHCGDCRPRPRTISRRHNVSGNSLWRIGWKATDRARSPVDGTAVCRGPFRHRLASMVFFAAGDVPGFAGDVGGLL